MQHFVSNFPEKIVVSELVGSLPNGGKVMRTPIWAFKECPLEMDFNVTNSSDLSVSKISITDKLPAFLLDNVISEAEANVVIAASEYFGFRDEAPGIQTPPGMRMNKAVHFLGDREI